MFGDLKSIVDIIRDGVTGFKSAQSAKKRETAVLEMLYVYFLLKDCVDVGEKLVKEAEPNPVQTIAAMDPATALDTLERWDAALRMQGIRLYQLQGLLLGQDHIAVLNPDLQSKLSKVVGYKLDRACTLHGIGAALFFKNMFPRSETEEEKARYISLMAGEEEDNLDMDRIRREIKELKSSLDDYRAVVDRLVSDEEILRLSTRAREYTLLTENS